MYLAYFDESGDTGKFPGGTQLFVLACILMPADKWVPAFEEVIRWRRGLKNRFGLPVRAEIKANYLVGARGSIASLGLRPDQRGDIYREGLELVGRLDAKVFAIAINKSALIPGTRTDPLDTAWQYALQRVEKLTSASEPVMVIHDDGERDRVRAIARKARRAAFAGSAFGGGIRSAPLVGLLDDPVARNSAESYFIQLADLVAYCAFRAALPSASRTKVVDGSTWGSLGTSLYREATSLRPGPAPGIVLWPK